MCILKMLPCLLNITKNFKTGNPLVSVYATIVMDVAFSRNFFSALFQDVHELDLEMSAWHIAHATGIFCNPYPGLCHW